MCLVDKRKEKVNGTAEETLGPLFAFNCQGKMKDILDNAHHLFFHWR